MFLGACTHGRADQRVPLGTLKTALSDIGCCEHTESVAWWRRRVKLKGRRGREAQLTGTSSSQADNVGDQYPQAAAVRTGVPASLTRDELVDAVQSLSMTTEIETVQAIVLAAARRLVGADGATFVLRDGDQCHYVDEDAIGPLWRGRRFPMSACITGWVMYERRPAVVPDIAVDERIPYDVYRPTFVRSLVALPIRTEDPVGAIGVYWATERVPTDDEVAALQALATATAVSIERLRAEHEVALHVAELEQANRSLRDANRMLEHFASVASHDLRSPLATIEGLISTVYERPEGELGPTDRTLLERARGQAHALTESVDALLALARVRGQRLQITPVDLGEVVDGVVEALRPEIEQADADVEVAALPVVPGDRAMLRLLLQNLLANALHYRHPARHQVVEVAAEQHEDAWRLTVTDRGQGIDPAKREKIFGMFTAQASSAASAIGLHDGSGIGLATCRRIVERHGGTIAVEPRREGARFVVTLPRWS